MSGSALITSPARRFLALSGRHSYLAAAALVLSGCGPRPQAVTPAGASFVASTRDAFQDAARSTLPVGHRIARIGWRAENGDLQLSGSGAVRIAPPDSLRLDVAATLGLGRSTLIMAGESASAQPEATLDQILPDRFALWAALGVMRAPPRAVSFEVADAAGTSAWRVTDAAGRATVFSLRDGVLSSVTRLDHDAVASQLRLTRDTEGRVSRASLVDTGRQFRLQVDVSAWETSEGFAPEIWHLRP
jgi:hypothetical protein